MSTLGGYPEYTKECSVHWENTISTLGHIIVSVGDIKSLQEGVQYTRLPYSINGVINDLPHIDRDLKGQLQRFYKMVYMKQQWKS